MESDLNDLEVSLQTSRRQAEESQKQTKTLTNSLKELTTKLDDTQRSIEDNREQGAVADKRVGLLSASFTLFKSSTEFFDFSGHQTNTLISDGTLFSVVFDRSLGIIELGGQFLQAVSQSLGLFL